MQSSDRPIVTRVALLALAAILAGSIHLAAQAPAARDLEAGGPRPAPVLVAGETVLWITAGSGPYTPEFRAERIALRIAEIVHDRSIRDPTVTVTEAEGSSELRVGPRLLMVVTAADASSIGTARPLLAQTFAQVLERAIREERLRYAPATLLRSGLFGLVATLLFLVVTWTIVRVTSVLRRRLSVRFASSSTIGVLREEGLLWGNAARAAMGVVLAIRLVLIVLAFDLYLTYVLGLFPWTRAVSHKLVGYAYAPVRSVAMSFGAYLPKLLFLIVIVAVVYGAIKIVGIFFRSIGRGRLVFANFPAEWADPTNKIVRVLLIAFGVVVAFPYLPASDSPAFAGVSVFIGVLVSLASSSALSNMIAGTVLTYTGAFRIGDRVRIGDAFGDIVETSLLATRLRTIKNENVTIPNGIALGSAVTNYTREARTRGLILHTTVTIGYDAPWRQVHALLIDAARGTPGVLAEPEPFVWQTSLNDFYVSYEVNAYTASAAEMIDIYAALHARIQDVFSAAGVEIMSPHVTAIRDGNIIAIPEASRAPGYRAPAFRVQDTTPATSSSS